MLVTLGVDVPPCEPAEPAAADPDEPGPDGGDVGCAGEGGYEPGEDVGLLGRAQGLRPEDVREQLVQHHDDLKRHDHQRPQEEERDDLADPIRRVDVLSHELRPGHLLGRLPRARGQLLEREPGLVLELLTARSHRDTRGEGGERPWPGTGAR